MNRTMRKRSKYFKRFVLSFLIVLVLPVIVFTSVFMNDFRTTYVNKIQDQICSDLDRAGDELDRHLENLHSVVLYNSRLPHMQPYYIRHDITATDIISTLAAEAAVNSMVDSIYFYSPATSHRIYTENGTYTLDYFARLELGIQGKKEMLQMWKEMPENGWLTWDGTKGTQLQYVITTDSGDTWFFNIAQKELITILEKADVNTALQTADGKVLFSANRCTADVQDINYQIETNSVKNRFILTRSSTEDTFFQEVLTWQSRFLVTVGLVLLAGFALVTVLTFYNEKPLASIRSFITGKMHIPEGIHGVDLVMFSFENMEDRMQLLEQQRKHERLLLHLVLSDGTHIEHIIKHLQNDGIFQKARYFRVLVVTAHSEDASTRIERYLEMTASEGTELRSLAAVAENKRLFVLGLTEDAEQALQEKLEKAGRILYEDLGDLVRFYVGGRCGQLQDLHHSYKEAIICSREETEEQITFFRGTRSEKQTFQYPAEQVEMLYNALVETDIEKANMLTETLLTFLTQHEQSKYLSASIYYDLINAYYKAQTKLETDEEVLELDVILANTKNSGNTQEKISHVWELFRQYVDSMENSEKEKNKDIIPKVIDFIEQNITSYDLSVGMVADQFGVSISNLSHQFKARMNCTISGYITQKKFAYAGEQLIVTDESISVIAEKLGYSQATSFIRKFKQFYGVTPTEYRSQNRQDAEETTD